MFVSFVSCDDFRAKLRSAGRDKFLKKQAEPRPENALVIILGTGSKAEAWSDVATAILADHLNMFCFPGLRFMHQSYKAIGLQSSKSVTATRGVAVSMSAS